MRSAFPLCLFVCVGTLLGLSSCSSLVPPPEPVHELTAYEQFTAKPGYPVLMEAYTDEALMQQASAQSPIVICLSQQRARLYVNDQVAMDWPVSTGVSSHPTPTGSFKIRFKEQQHCSNRYGRIYNAEGKCINGNADIFKDALPEGGRFDGAPMPNWMRLTADGVGMHTGKVKAGQRLSHGCIRTPHKIALRLFRLTKVGTPVTITEEPEPLFPRLPEQAQLPTVKHPVPASAETPKPSA